MSLCRECEVVLWRGHETCPCCAARRPGLRLRVAQRPSRVGALGRAVGLAAAAPAAVAADRLLCRLVG